jgi:hypothetical protein
MKKLIRTLRGFFFFSVVPFLSQRPAVNNSAVIELGSLPTRF